MLIMFTLQNFIPLLHCTINFKLFILFPVFVVCFAILRPYVYVCYTNYHRLELLRDFYPMKGRTGRDKSMWGFVRGSSTLQILLWGWEQTVSKHWGKNNHKCKKKKRKNKLSDFPPNKQPCFLKQPQKKQPVNRNIFMIFSLLVFICRCINIVHYYIAKILEHVTDTSSLLPRCVLLDWLFKQQIVLSIYYWL